MCCAHAKKKTIIGKPFDKILLKTKVSQCSGNPLYRVDVAIELEPVNAVTKFHRKTFHRNDVCQMSR